MYNACTNNSETKKILFRVSDCNYYHSCNIPYSVISTMTMQCTLNVVDIYYKFACNLIHVKALPPGGTTRYLVRTFFVFLCMSYSIGIMCFCIPSFFSHLFIDAYHEHCFVVCVAYVVTMYQIFDFI